MLPHPHPHRQRVFGVVLSLAAITSFQPQGSPAAARRAAPAEVRATVETDPVAHSGDAADDPAIWYDSDNPARSIVIGNDKQGALETYDLRGDRVQRFTGGFFGNVDVRSGIPTGRGPRDLVVAWRKGIAVYAMDPASRRMANIVEHASGSIPVPTGGEGLCLYRSPATSKLFAFVIARNGYVAQYELLDSNGDGRIEGRLRRGWAIGSEAEGCVADDRLGHLYISEEAAGVWKYDAEPAAPSARWARTLVEAVRADGGRIRADAEGLTIVYGRDGAGYLIVSSQAASDTLNSYLVFERSGDNRFVREFQVVDGPAADGCARTDGIDALAADLGPAFPQGIFICQDNSNTAPSPGRQNFKFVPLERVVGR